MRISDWSSDVCSSDLGIAVGGHAGKAIVAGPGERQISKARIPINPPTHPAAPRRFCSLPSRARRDRKSVVLGKSVAVRVELGGRRTIIKKIPNLSHIFT